MRESLNPIIDFLTDNYSWLGTAFVTIIGGIWVVTAYRHSKKLEYQKAFNERQIEIVLLTAQTAGDLAAIDSEPEWKLARQRFWELYWGRLVLFEDEAVINAMIALGGKLGNLPFKRRAAIKHDCYAVSLALRSFLEKKNSEDWKISFELLTSPVREKKIKQGSGG